MHTLLPALICGVTIAVSPALRAQDTPATSGTNALGKGHWDAAGRLDRLTQALGLTPDQQAKIKPILNDETQKIQALRNDTSVPKDQVRTKMKDIRDATNTAIKALLTPDQVTKFDALQQQRQGHGKGGKGG